MSGRVVFIADRIAHWNAGTERQLLLLGTELKKRGWEVPLYVFRQSESITVGQWPDVMTYINCNRIASPFTWWRLYWLARKEKDKSAKIAHCFFNDSSIIVPPVFRLAGLKTIVSRRDMGFWYTSINRAVLRVVRHFVAAVVANSKAVANSVIENEGYSPESVKVIYNGLTTSGTTANASADGRLVIGIVANIRTVKRIDDAIRAFAIVSRNYPNAIMRIVGAGDTTDLEQLAQSQGIEGKVEFVGQSREPQVEISRFSIAMLTSESEGLSNAIIEYMQAGVPVICTDTGGNPELVAHNVSGLLVPVGDIVGLADCLTQLLRDENRREKMGEQARQSVLRLCSTQAMVDAYQSLYAEVAG